MPGVCNSVEVHAKMIYLGASTQINSIGVVFYGVIQLSNLIRTHKLARSCECDVILEMLCMNCIYVFVTECCLLF